jgi:hypothetical protein
MILDRLFSVDEIEVAGIIWLPFVHFCIEAIIHFYLMIESRSAKQNYSSPAGASSINAGREPCVKHTTLPSPVGATQNTGRRTTSRLELILG